MAHTEAQPSASSSSVRRNGSSGIAPRAPVTRILRSGTSLGGRLGELAGKSVLLATGSQLTTALALIELDGVARRLTILPPDADPDHFAALIAGAEIDAVVVDSSSAQPTSSIFRFASPARRRSARREHLPPAQLQTEWVMLTSGTTGVPKMVVHTLAGLTASFRGESRRIQAWSGAPSTTSAAMAACRFFCARCSAARRSCCRAPASRSPIISTRLAAHGVTHRLGHADALAPRADVAGDQENLAALCAACPARSPTRRFSTVCATRFRRPSSVTLTLRPKPASLSKSATGLPAFRLSYVEAGPRRRRDEGRGRLAAHPLAAHGFALCRHRCAARRQRRLCRHRRHGGTARRSLCFRRPPRRHHQYRRPESSSRGGRGGDQPASAGAHVAGAWRSAARSPARS